MKKTTKNPTPTTLEPAATTLPIAYPLHDSWIVVTEKTNTEGRAIVTRGDPPTEMIRTCAGSMILTEQATLPMQLGHLFCLTCRAVVPVTPEEQARALAAATSEGWEPVTKGDLTPGTLPADGRAALLYHHHLPLVGPGGSGGVCAGDMRAAITLGWPTLQALGLAEPHGHALTQAGLFMQDKIVNPDVPAAAIERASAGSAAKYAKAERARSKRPRAPKPAAFAAPMVCECGHGPRAHLAGEGADTRDAPCDKCPRGACKSYRQVKAAKVAKAPKKGKKPGAEVTAP